MMLAIGAILTLYIKTDTKQSCSNHAYDYHKISYCEDSGKNKNAFHAFKCFMATTPLLLMLAIFSYPNNGYLLLHPCTGVC